MKWLVDIYSMATNRYVLLMAALFLLLLFVAFDGYQLFNLRAMQLEEDLMHGIIAEHWLLATVFYIIVFAAFVGISAPGSFISPMLGGFLFGPFVGGTLATIAATLGALVLYEVMRHVIGSDLERRLSPFEADIRSGFENHGFSYMVILRVAPAFPFWVINLVPALLGINRKVNALTAFVGIAPASYVYAALGAGLHGLLQKGHALNFDNILTDQTILLPLNALVLLVVLPLIVKSWCYYKEHKALNVKRKIDL